MIGLLRGVLREREAGRVLLDVGGVGYSVHVPMSTFLELPAEGAEVELLIVTQVREDAITLFGFRNGSEREVFERLLGVSGVGPRTALAALSALGSDPLVTAIRDGDTKLLSGIPGIGRKTAERMVVDLRDRLGAPGPGPAVGRPADAASDVISALVNLGYAEKAAAKAVAGAAEESADESPVFEDLLRRALRQLTRS